MVVSSDVFATVGDWNSRRRGAMASLQAVLLEDAEDDVPGVVVAVDGAVEEFEVVEGVVRVVVGSIPLGDDVVDVREGHRRRRRVEGRGVAGDRRGRQ